MRDTSGVARKLLRTGPAGAVENAGKIVQKTGLAVLQRARLQSRPEAKQAIWNWIGSGKNS
jgi:hypothetical protein